MTFWRDMEEAQTEIPDEEEYAVPQNVTNNVNAAIQQLSSAQPQKVEVPQESETIDEVEKRLHKANLYRLILDNPLFETDDDELSREVEQEFRQFAIDRLKALMGLQAPSASVPFTDEQVRVLAIWADKLAGKPSLISKASTPAPTPPKKVEHKEPALRAVTTTRKKRQPKAAAPPPAQSLPPDVKTDDDGRKYREVTTQLPSGQEVTVKEYAQPQPPPGVRKPPPDPQTALMHGIAQAAEVEKAGIMGQIITMYSNGQES